MCLIYCSGTDLELRVDISGKTTNNRNTRIWTQILNRKDGLYIARYKLYEPCGEIEINVTYDNIHLAESPYLINNIVYSEDCDCPQHSSTDTFLNAWKCTNEEQILRDLSNFRHIDWNLIRDSVKKFFVQSFEMICALKLSF